MARLVVPLLSSEGTPRIARVRLKAVADSEMRGADICTYPTLQVQVGEQLH